MKYPAFSAPRRFVPALAWFFDPVRFSLPALLWGLCLIAALAPVTPYAAQFLFLGLAGLFSWGAVMAVRGVRESRRLSWRHPVVLAMLLITGWALASLIWSPVKAVTIVALGVFAALPLTFLFGAWAGRVQDMRMLGALLFPLWGVLGAWALIQFFALGDLFWGQARHPLSDPSMLGAFLSAGFLAALGVMLVVQSRFLLIGAGLVAFLSGAGILATAARAPVVALVPVLLIMAVLLWPRVKKSWRALTLLFVALGLMAASMTWFSERNMWDRLVASIESEDVTTKRVHLWDAAVEIGRDHLVTGTGYGTFFLHLPAYKGAAHPYATHHAHSDPLQWFAELGAVGVALFYGFLIVAAFYSVRGFWAARGKMVASLDAGEGADSAAANIVAKARTQASADVEADASADISANENAGASADASGVNSAAQFPLALYAAAVTAFCVLLCLIVQSHVGFVLYNLSLLMVAGLALAVWFAALRRLGGNEPGLSAAQDRPGIKYDAGFSVMALLCLPFVLGGYGVLGVAAADYNVTRAAQALQAHRMDDFVIHVNRAGRIGHGLNYRVYLLAVDVPLMLLQDGRAMMTLSEKQALYDQGASYMQTALMLNPRNGSAYYYWGKLQEVAGAGIKTGDAPAPRSLYEHALRLDPMHLPARLALHDLLAAQGAGTPERLAVMEPGLGFHYNSSLAARYYALMMSLYQEAGNDIKIPEVAARMQRYQERGAISLQRRKSALSPLIGEAYDGM